MMLNLSSTSSSLIYTHTPTNTHMLFHIKIHGRHHRHHHPSYTTSLRLAPRWAPRPTLRFQQHRHDVGGVCDASRSAS